MIISNKIIEKSPFKEAKRNQDFSKLKYMYPTVRQGLYQYFKFFKNLSVLLPDYVPEGVYDPFRALGFNIHFYHIYQDFTINKEEIVSLITLNKIDVFVYIHYFGLYHKKNMEIIKKIINPNILFIEDFAHTVYSKEVPIIGDIALYSYTKMFGVYEGSLLWFRNKNYFINNNYEHITHCAKKLSRRLKISFYLEYFLGNISFTPQVDKIVCYLSRKVNKVMGKREDNLYYNFLMDNYTKIACRISDTTIQLLNRVNFNGVIGKRKSNAEIYLAYLDKRFLFPIPRSYYILQALYAFPIYVESVQKFNSYLSENGIRSLNHTALWWFTSDSKKEPFFDHHSLLPTNHYLSPEKIKKIISVVNNFLNV